MRQKRTWLKEIVTMSHDDHTSTAVGVSAEKEHLNSGIIVFSSTRKPLYMNAAAQRLLLRLNQAESGHSPIPKAVDNLLNEILPLLTIGGKDGSWRQLESRRFTMAPDRSMVVKTFGIPDRRDSERALIVLTIQESLLS
jgi:hypothetical protein